MTQLTAPDFKLREDLDAFFAEHGENAFIESHRRLAMRVAERVWNKAVEGRAGIQIDDLVNYVLFEVVCKNRDEWAEFSGSQSWHSFLISRMGWRMLDLIRLTSRDTRRLTQRLGHWNRKASELQISLGRMPTVEEVCEAAQMSVKSYYELAEEHRERQWVQLENRRGKTDDGASEAEAARMSWAEIDTGSCADDPAEHLALIEMVRLVLRRAGQHWDRVAVFAYYFLGLTMKEVGGVISASESRVSQATTAIVQHFIAMNLDVELFGRHFSTRGGMPTADPLPAALQTLWDTLPRTKQLEVVQELNLCSFALRPPRVERDKARTYRIDLPPGFRVGKPVASSLGGGKFCVLLKNEEEVLA